jgi:hypothetical protein
VEEVEEVVECMRGSVGDDTATPSCAPSGHIYNRSLVRTEPDLFQGEFRLFQAVSARLRLD